MQLNTNFMQFCRVPKISHDRVLQTNSEVVALKIVAFPNSFNSGGVCRMMNVIVPLRS